MRMETLGSSEELPSAMVKSLYNTKGLYGDHIGSCKQATRVYTRSLDHGASASRVYGCQWTAGNWQHAETSSKNCSVYLRVVAMVARTRSSYHNSCVVPPGAPGALDAQA